MAFSVNETRMRVSEGKRDEVPINKHPDQCPWCDYSIESKFVTAHSLEMPWDYDETVEAVFKCPREKCGRYYLAYYTKTSRMSDYFVLNGTGVRYYVDLPDFPEAITNISPQFVTIYYQALTAEGMKLLEVAGPGYGKALEFLVKDFLIKQNPTEKEKIETEFLGDSIKRINDPKINVCASRAAWLRNDEAHYKRKFEDKDVTNLKDLIRLTTIWIESFVLTSQYEKDITYKKNSPK